MRKRFVPDFWKHSRGIITYYWMQPNSRETPNNIWYYRIFLEIQILDSVVSSVIRWSIGVKSRLSFRLFHHSVQLEFLWCCKKKEIKQKLQTKRPQTNKQKISFIQKSKNRLQPIPTNYTCWKLDFLKMLKKIILLRVNSITLWGTMEKSRFRHAVLWTSPKWSVSHPYLLRFMVWLNSSNISDSA